MGGSTITVQNILDRVAAKSIPVPLAGPAGYSTDLAVAMANDVMADIVTERFNWKWNRIVAQPFFTNTFQQDYPQIGLTNVGWLEDADRIDINNTALPPPLKNLTVRRQLSRTNLAWTPVAEICWNYNNQLFYGTWPGPGVTFYPQITNLVKQNPMMSMIDSNGNLLIVTQIGTTGLTAPSLPAAPFQSTQIAYVGLNIQPTYQEIGIACTAMPFTVGQSVAFNGLTNATWLNGQNAIIGAISGNTIFSIAGSWLQSPTLPTVPLLPTADTGNVIPGMTLTDGTVVWTLVSPTAQGWRVSPMPPAAGPVWQIIPYYQARPPKILIIGQTIDPIPDDYSRYFQEGMEAYCLQASPNPADRQRFEAAYAKWIGGMENAKKQGDKENDSYALLPATVPVEQIYSWTRNPMDPSQPY